MKTILALVAAGHEFTILHTLDGFRAILSQPEDGVSVAADGTTPEQAIENLIQKLS